MVFGKSRRSSGVEESITQQRAARKSVEAVHIAGTRVRNSQLPDSPSVPPLPPLDGGGRKTLRLSARRFFSSSSTNSTESWSSRIPPRRSSAILEHLCDGADGERHTLESAWRVARAEHERRFVRQYESSSPRSPQQLFLCSRFRLPRHHSCCSEKCATASKASHTRRAPLPCSQTCAPLTLVPLSKLRRSFPAGAKAPAPAHENISRNKGAA